MQGDCIEISKESGLIVHSWIEEANLSYLNMSSF